MTVNLKGSNCCCTGRMNDIRYTNSKTEDYVIKQLLGSNKYFTLTYVVSNHVTHMEVTSNCTISQLWKFLNCFNLNRKTVCSYMT